MLMEKTHQHRSRGIYLLPNLLTTAGLFAGFYSIVAAMQGRFGAAAVAIFVAMITDFLDGRVARLTQSQTAFGQQYDSLSDMVACGIAPALVVYSWALHDLGKLGWLAAFIYSAAVALRLARFNTQAKTEDKRFFQGLPSPAGAGVIAASVWFGHSYAHIHTFMQFGVGVLTVAVGALMVSNVRYRSFKELDGKGRVPFVALLVIVLVFVAISLDPPTILLLIFTLYALSGPIMTLARLRKIKRFKRRHQVKNQSKAHVKTKPR